MLMHVNKLNVDAGSTTVTMSYEEVRLVATALYDAAEKDKRYEDLKWTFAKLQLLLKDGWLGDFPKPKDKTRG